jgi:hypothetical protein
VIAELADHMLLQPSSAKTTAPQFVTDTLEIFLDDHAKRILNRLISLFGVGRSPCLSRCLGIDAALKLIVKPSRFLSGGGRGEPRLQGDLVPAAGQRIAEGKAAFTAGMDFYIEPIAKRLLVA